MNKNILIATAITAGTAALVYLLKKRMANKPATEKAMDQSRHVTDVFSKAKERV